MSGGRRHRFAPALLRALLACALILPFVSFSATPAFAQKGKIVSAGQLVIAGRRMRCGKTPTLIRDFDGLAQSSSLIVLNMRALNALPKTVRWLVYYHECGHIHVGASEAAADCWAVKRARAEGWLTETGLSEACETFNRVGHSAAHLEPQERCNLLRRCFRSRSGAIANTHTTRALLVPDDRDQ